MVALPSPKTRRWTLDTDAPEPPDVVCVQCDSDVRHLLGTVSAYVEHHNKDHDDLYLTFQRELYQSRNKLWDMTTGMELPPEQRTVPGRPEYPDELSLHLNYARTTALLLELAKHIASGPTTAFVVTFTGKLVQTQESP